MKLRALPVLVLLLVIVALGLAGAVALLFYAVFYALPGAAR